jgi:hypothetical protein
MPNGTGGTAGKGTPSAGNVQVDKWMTISFTWSASNGTLHVSGYMGDDDRRKKKRKFFDKLAVNTALGPSMDKQTANYRPRDPAYPEKRCGRCSMYRAADLSGKQSVHFGFCTLVEGAIDPDDTCDHFDKRASFCSAEHYSSPQPLNKRWSDEMIEKVGARHSKADMQSIHDLAVRQGAHCNGKTEKNLKAEDARIFKVDESLGLVFGYAIVCKMNGEPSISTSTPTAPRCPSTSRKQPCSSQRPSS